MVLKLFLIFVTFVAGAMIAGIAAFILAAGGHGWNASVLSAASIVIGPAGTAAWLLRHSQPGRWLAAVTVASWALVDVAMIVLTAREGWSYVGEAWQHVPGFLLVWAVACISLQIPPLAALCHRQRVQKHDPHPSQKPSAA
jgi:hypothetical protein